METLKNTDIECKPAEDFEKTEFLKKAFISLA